MAKSTSLRAQNNTGSIIKANRAVYISGVDQDKQIPTIALASNDNENKMPAVGIVVEDILNGQDGLVKISGVLVGFNTSEILSNSPVFIGRSGGLLYSNPAEITNTKVVQQVGTVSYVAEEPEGQIFLFPLELQRKHAITHKPNKADAFIHAAQHELGGGDEISHSRLKDIDQDAHVIYPLVTGGRGFTGKVSGIDPTSAGQLATKNYVDTNLPMGGFSAGEWIRQNVSAAQTDLPMGQSTFLTTEYKVVMPFAGSIVGIAAREAAGTVAAGSTISFKATIDGASNGTATVSIAIGASSNYATFSSGSVTFTAGQQLGIAFTTGALWSSTTNDYNAWLIIKI